MPSEKPYVDLVEFFDKWPDERQRILRLAASGGLDKSERDLLSTMIFVVDRVGPKEIEA